MYLGTVGATDGFAWRPQSYWGDLIISAASSERNPDEPKRSDHA